MPKSLEVSEIISIFATSIYKMDYPVKFRVGAGSYRHRPVLKSCFGGSLFVIPFYKGFEEVAALDRSSFQKYRLVTFVHEDFHGIWVAMSNSGMILFLIMNSSTKIRIKRQSTKSFTPVFTQAQVLNPILNPMVKSL